MTQASLRPPVYLQPRPKATSTSRSTSIEAVSTSTIPELSPSLSQSRHSSPLRATASVDSSDKATAALIRRVLCPHSHSGADKDRRIEELLPPLTSSNEVDLQLYAIIAIVVKDLVQSWYGKITPDQNFVEEVIRIVAHCTRALETRLRSVDLESLILDEIPELVERHIQAYRISRESGHTGGLSTNARIIYHDLNPHPALEPIPQDGTIEEQAKNEADYRQLLVQGALAVLLPTEDLENACLRTLVADVIAEPILGNSIGGKVCESWFIWTSITKLVEAVKARIEPKATGTEIEVDTRSRLEKFGLLSGKEEKTGRRREYRRSRLSSTFWRSLQYGYLIFMAVRFIMVGLFAAHAQPLRSSTTPTPARSVPASPMAESFQSRVGPPRAILSFEIFPLISTLLDLSYRMPWLCATLAVWQHHLVQGTLRVVGGTNGLLDQ